MIAVVFPVFAFFAASLLASVLGIVASRAVEEVNLTHAAQLLGQDGHDWAMIRANGSRIELSGTAPNHSARSSAVSGLQAAFGRQSVRDSTRVRLPAAGPSALALPQPKLWLIKSHDSIVLFGAVASERERKTLIDTIDENFPQSTVQDMTRVSSSRFPADWNTVFEFGSKAFLAEGTVSVELTAGQIAVTVLAETEEHGQQLRSQLQEMSRANLAVDVTVETLPAPASPLTGDFTATATNETDVAQAKLGDFLTISSGANGFLEFASKRCRAARRGRRRSGRRPAPAIPTSHRPTIARRGSATHRRTATDCRGLPPARLRASC